MPSVKSIFYLLLSSFVLYVAYRERYWLKSHEKIMQSQSDIERVAGDLLASINLRFVSSRTLQSLWAGYGHICHIVAAPLHGDASEQSSLILKYITPPQAPGRDPRPDEGHLRKLLSYQVELAFYTHLAPLLPPHVAVASCLASINSGPAAAPSAPSAPDVEFKTAMLLTDLRPAFPVAGERRGALPEAQVYAALGWLADFHGFWWRRDRDGGGGGGGGLFDRGRLVRPPLAHFEEHGDAFIRSAAAAGPDGEGKAASVWLNGGYTYLETRRGEYAGLCEDDGSEWAGLLCRPVAGREMSAAELVARALAPEAEGGGGALAAYQTLIHGDVKSENLFTNKQGDRVAFYDFQYVGLGIGACDLAKLFTCSVPRSMLLKGTTGGKRDGGGRQLLLPMEEGEEKLLRFYLERLQRASGKSYEWDAFVRHWETALVDWLRFQASWGFWGNTEWLEGRARSILADRAWMEWLRAATTE